MYCIFCEACKSNHVCSAYFLQVSIEINAISYRIYCIYYAPLLYNSNVYVIYYALLLYSNIEYIEYIEYMLYTLCTLCTFII